MKVVISRCNGDGAAKDPAEKNRLILELPGAPRGVRAPLWKTLDGWLNADGVGRERFCL